MYIFSRREPLRKGIHYAKIKKKGGEYLQDWKKAKALLPGNSCVFCREDRVYTCQKSGIAPLLGMLETDLRGFCVADKVVGKAAAMLYCLMEVRAVYAPVMSKAAVQMLQSHGILTQWEVSPDAIQNRQGNGICPMEQAVAALCDPGEAPAVLRRTLERLTKA